MNIVTTLGIAAFMAAGIYLFGYNSGADSVENDLRIANERYATDMAKQKEQLVQLNEKLEIKTHDRITVIKRVIDPTGCIDSPVPNAVIDSLH